MESDPGCEGYPIALQKSDAWGAAAAVEEAQMTWLTWRHVLLLQLLLCTCSVHILTLPRMLRGVAKMEKRFMMAVLAFSF